MATILVVEDSDSQRRAITETLTSGKLSERILGARDALEAISVLHEEPVDLVICDLELPQSDGRRVIHFKEASAELAEIPLVVLTSAMDLAAHARLLDGGACDVVTKPFHPADLVARVRLHLKVRRLQQELREKNARLLELSRTDELTGLRNRRSFVRVLTRECQKAIRYQMPLALAMLDLDHFKKVNDLWGHLGGDEVLKRVAETLYANTRRTDLVSRYGGEEFAVILVASGVSEAALYAEGIRRRIEALSVAIPASSDEIRVTLSIGVAEWRPEWSRAEDLVAAADHALYRAKEAGRNRVCASLDEGTMSIEAGGERPRSVRLGEPGRTESVE